MIHRVDAFIIHCTIMEHHANVTIQLLTHRIQAIAELYVESGSLIFNYNHIRPVFGDNFDDVWYWNQTWLILIGVHAKFFNVRNIKPIPTSFDEKLKDIA